MDEEDVDLPTEEAESSKDGSLSHQNSESGGGEYDDDNNNSDDNTLPAPSAVVVEAREILAEETSVHSENVLQIITSSLKEVKKLYQHGMMPTRAMKLIMHLTAISKYITLCDHLCQFPRCQCPAMFASYKVAVIFTGRTALPANTHLLIERGHLPMSKGEKRQGHYTLIDNEDVRRGVHVYLTAQNLGTISPHELRQHLHTVLLPALGYMGQDAEISEHSVHNWLHVLGYQYVNTSNGLYHDGHERPDVVAARCCFVNKMATYEHLMIHYEGEDMAPIYPNLKPGEKLHIVLDHDECIYHINDARRRMWLAEGQKPLKSKGNGRAIHVSDFICEPIGCLWLVGEKLLENEQLPNGSPHKLVKTAAQKIIYPGKNHDKWWDMAQLLEQLRTAVDIFERQFLDCVGIWEFDCSSAHEALAPDALNVNHMSVNPGGKQSRMHDTVIPLSNPSPKLRCPDVCGQPQSLVFPESHPDPSGKTLYEEGDLKTRPPKGMRLVVQEHVAVWDKLCDMVGGEKHVVGRCNSCKISAQKKDVMRRIAEAEGAGRDDALEDLEAASEEAVIDEPANDWCCLHRVLSKQDDFVNEKPMIQMYLESRGHVCMFLPKFHCELAAIEMVWGFGKYHELSKFTTAQVLIPKCLDMANKITIRRFFRKTWRYLDAYRKGLNARQAAFAVKKYKSHRRVGTEAEIIAAIQEQDARRAGLN
ncbi:hypothetical protein FISHEDRAFT_45850 [Fistulina hepatica ATCC 64428]|uniref:Uncharacterized protein n=1 Tax=Fistulina hepatica ATCC 64428 TaxID=1128425 RepID=A0A0D7A822_9AGAR|nr:hypothetical protein FISHEDRAFT_45850 [Fistulina hepatica ATCC 64428]